MKQKNERIEESLKITRLRPEDAQQLSFLFVQIAKDSEAKYFHPHAFTEEYANKIANYKGLDIYLGAFHKQNLVGYGLLRGMDAGYAIPSLGIYLSTAVRGRGFSGFFMSELHRFAAEIGATQIRLKVHPENIAAMNLYKRIGYVFMPEENGQVVGLLTI